MLTALPLGLGDDSVALIWTCVERREPEAPAAAWWASLPQRFSTGRAQSSQVKMGFGQGG
mgnify:CR=1 FL=1